MYLVMVDDSEEKNPRRDDLGHLVGVAGVIFPETAIAAYRDGIRALRDELGIPAGVELKWSPDDGSWLKSPDGNAIRTELRKRMLALGVEVGAASLAVVWDRKRTPSPVNEVRKKVLQYLYDKLSFTLQRNYPSTSIAVLIADEPGGGPADQKAWLADTLRLTDNGTQWSRPDQIVLPIVTTPSHHVPHLQLADLVAGATVAAVAGNKFAMELLPDVNALAARHYMHGSIGGVGLTLWPPGLDNLYFHVCGDSYRWRGNMGVPLPYEKWDYHDTDGIPGVTPSPPSGSTS